MKQKKPIYKRVWFWILVVVIIGGIASTAGNGSEQAEQTEEVEQVTEAENTAERQNEAMANDAAIWSILQDDTSVLLGLQDVLEQDALTIYDYCKKAESRAMDNFMDIGQYKDVHNKDYIDAVMMYTSNAQSIYKDIMKYLDTGKVGKLESANESIDRAGAYRTKAINERKAYLSAVGFSDEDVEAIVNP